MSSPHTTMLTPAARLALHSNVNEAGCHIWNRAKNNRGYGVMFHDGKVRLAHRVSWFAKHGRWPAEGMVVDHMCDVKDCVNSEHLQELTNRENILRAKMSPMNVMLRRTACGRGHEYTDETIRLDSKGHRQCRVCDDIRRCSK